MNNFKKIVKDTILRSDLLSSNVSFRFSGSSVYESYCLGIVSIITFSAFLIIFIIKFLSVLQLQNITAFQHLVDNIDSSSPVQNVMFAMTIDGLNMTTIDKYFEFTVTEVNLSRPQGSNDPKIRTSREILLLPCQISYWQDIGIEGMSTIFQKRGMSAYYCPTEQFSIQGTSDQDTYIYSEIRLKRCNQSSPFCQKNATLRNTYYESYVQTNDYFTVKLFLKDSIISPTSESAVSNYLQRDIFLQFSTTTGTVGYIKLADFEIDTDKNLMPWSQYDTQTGYYIERFQTSTVPSATRFLYLKLEKSTKKLTVERQYGKIDDLMSYIGGLFGLLFYCIEFFMSSYNEYRYELAIGETMFNYNEKGDQFKEQDMNFWTYIKYSVYDWLGVLNLQSQKWTEMKTIQDTREEINEQLDVRYLMQRVRFLENTVEVLTNHQQRMCLMLAQLPSVQKLKKTRQVSQFYNKHKYGESSDQIGSNEDKQLKQKEGNSQEKYYKNKYQIGNIQGKSIQLTEMVTHLNKIPPRKQNHYKNNSFDNQSSNILQLPSNNQIESVNSIEGQIMPPIQNQSENQNEEEFLMIELHQALAKISKNLNDPINAKIIQMLNPLLIKKILQRTQQKHFSIHSNGNNMSALLNDSNIPINLIEPNLFIQLKKQRNQPYNSDKL